MEEIEFVSSLIWPDSSRDQNKVALMITRCIAYILIVHLNA